MVKNKNTIATPPGVTIKEQLVDKNMSQKEFSARMDMSEKHISKLINGEVLLTTDMAMRLEMVLGIPAHFWNNLESIYREKLALINEENEMEEDKLIVKKFPYKEMVKFGWIREANTLEGKVFELRKFFEIVKLSMLTSKRISGIVCRRQAISDKADYALLAFAQRAKLEARNISTQPISIRKLQYAIPEIRSLTKENPESFCHRLELLLAQCGIALVFLPSISGSFLHGATFVDGNKIVMGLTVRGKDADKFWFSLFHEIGHIIKGHIFNDSLSINESELEADEYARDVLIPNKDLDSFVRNNKITLKTINDFASNEGIDEGILVGRLQKDGYIKYNQFNSLKKKYKLVM